MTADSAPHFVAPQRFQWHRIMIDPSEFAESPEDEPAGAPTFVTVCFYDTDTWDPYIMHDGVIRRAADVYTTFTLIKQEYPAAWNQY